MFRRSKKKTDTSTDGTTSSVAPTSSAQQYAQASDSQNNAPQLPPIENTSGGRFSGSAAGSASEASKPLPPTHPLSTGQQSQPQEAVPQNYDAQPGPPAPVVSSPAPAEPSTANATLGSEEAAKQEPLDAGRVSPLNQGSTMEEARSGNVSAVDESSQPEEPVKTDSGIEQPKPDAVEESDGVYTSRA